MTPSTDSPLDTGTIVRSFPDMEAYDVALDNAGVTETNCMSVVGGIFLPFFGFKLHARLAVGTKVLVLRSTPCYILGTLPAEPPDLKSRGVGTATSDLDTDVRDMGSDDATGHNMSHQVPKDLLEGEFNITNALRVGIQFLTSLVKLQAGDKAKVECFVMDDLVRVVSGAFHHMSDFGDFKITNDNGQINCRWHGSSYDHEAWGVKQDRDPRVKSNTGGKLPDEPVAETGRWRFSQFLGYLGDFAHMFLHDPPNSLGVLAQEVAGKLHVHAGSDGNLLVQSITDITFELVTRIPVPVEQKRFDDPEGDTPSLPVSDFLDVWRMDPTKPWHLAYHIRDYARWLNSYHAYARFLQKDKDWKVPAEAETPAPSLAGGERDKEAAIPAVRRKPRTMYSCIRLLRDGSQMHLDGYGGCLVLSGGSAVLSMPLDVRIEAGRNIVMVAGCNIFAKAHRSVELVAVTGALLAKARTRLAMWAEKGTILLRTRMRRGAGDGDPKAHRFQRDSVGIVIEAPDSDVVLSSGGQTLVEGFGKDLTDKRPGVLIQSGTSDVHLRTNQEKGVYVSGGAFGARVKNWVVQAAEMWKAVAPSMNWGNLLFKAGGMLGATSFRADVLQAGRMTHGTQLKRSRDQHDNHVFYSQVDSVTKPSEGAGVASTEQNIPTPANASKSAAELVRAVCEYLPRSEYGTEAIPQAPAQQIASHPGTKHPASVTFEDWTFSDDAAEGDPLAADKHPWPGEGAQMLQSPSEATLHQPSSDTPDKFKPNPHELEPTAFVFKRWRKP